MGGYVNFVICAGFNLTDFDFDKMRDNHRKEYETDIGANIGVDNKTLNFQLSKYKERRCYRWAKVPKECCIPLWKASVPINEYIDTCDNFWNDPKYDYKNSDMYFNWDEKSKDYYYWKKIFEELGTVSCS